MKDNCSKLVPLQATITSPRRSRAQRATIRIASGTYLRALEGPMKGGGYGVREPSNICNL